MIFSRKIIWFALAVFATAGLRAETARELFVQGNAQLAGGRWDEAIAAFTAAISRQADYPEAYANRGYARRLKGDLDGAIADYTKAIELNPKLAPPHNHRGVAYTLKGEYGPAIADYTEALALNPKYGEACLNRAYAHFSTQDWRGAEADLRQFFVINRGDPDYARLYLWLAQGRQGKKAEADKELSEYLNHSRGMRPGDWPEQIGQFLLGKRTERDFLAAVTAPDAEAQKGRLCEAWFYAGEKRLVEGDGKGARECFRQCLATGKTDFVEYQLAAAGLKAMP